MIYMVMSNLMYNLKNIIYGGTRERQGADNSELYMTICSTQEQSSGNTNEGSLQWILLLSLAYLKRGC